MAHFCLTPTEPFILSVGDLCWMNGVENKIGKKDRQLEQTDDADRAALPHFCLLESITTRSVFRSSHWSLLDLYSIIINTDSCSYRGMIINRFRVSCSSSEAESILVVIYLVCWNESVNDMDGVQGYEEKPLYIPEPEPSNSFDQS